MWENWENSFSRLFSSENCICFVLQFFFFCILANILNSMTVVDQPKKNNRTPRAFEAFNHFFDLNKQKIAYSNIRQTSVDYQKVQLTGSLAAFTWWWWRQEWALEGIISESNKSTVGKRGECDDEDESTQIGHQTVKVAARRHTRNGKMDWIFFYFFLFSTFSSVAVVMESYYPSFSLLMFRILYFFCWGRIMDQKNLTKCKEQGRIWKKTENFYGHLSKEDFCRRNQRRKQDKVAFFQWPHALGHFASFTLSFSLDVGKVGDEWADAPKKRPKEMGESELNFHEFLFY